MPGRTRSKEATHGHGPRGRDATSTATKPATAKRTASSTLLLRIIFIQPSLPRPGPAGNRLSRSAGTKFRPPEPTGGFSLAPAKLAGRKRPLVRSAAKQSFAARVPKQSLGTRRQEAAQFRYPPR